MATIVPRAPLPETRLSGLPTVRVDNRVDLRGNERALEAVNQLGNVATDYAIQQQKINDTTAVMQARRELSDWEAQTFRPDNPEGISKYRGANALGASELVPQLDERIGEISSRLNPRQRAAFEGVSATFRDSLQGRLNGYMDREHSAYLEAEQKATIDNIGQDAIAAGVAGDWGRQDQVGQELVAINLARGEAAGWGPEQTKAAERQIVSTVRRETVSGLMTTNPFLAQEYYQRYADQMAPDDRATVERTLQPIVLDAEADALARAIWTGQNPEGAGDVDAQIEALEGAGQNPNSSARGVGQFLDSTWLEQIKRHRPDLAEGKSNAELLTLKDDPALGRELLSAFRKDNARSLTARGITASNENLYAAHHFGVGGATKFARASDGTPMTAILSRKEIEANPYLRGKTVGDVKANWAQRGLQVAAVSTPGGPPPTSEAEAIARSNATITDPRLRKVVNAKIREQGQIRDEQRREQERLLSETIYTSIARNTDPRKPLREIIGPEAFAFAERKGQLPALESQRRAALTGQVIQSNPVLVDALHREAVLSPNTFRKKNLYQSAGELSTDDLQDLLKMQTDITKPTKATEWATTNERIASGWITLGLEQTADTTGTRDEREEQRAAFSAMYRAAEKDFVQRTGKQPDPTQADVLLRNVTRAAAQQISSDRGLRLARGAAVEGFGLALPEATRAEIVADFEADVGRTPTEAEIVNIAARARMRGR